MVLTFCFSGELCWNFGHVMKAAYCTKEVYLPDRGDTRDPRAVRHSKSKAKSQLPSHEVLCWPALPGWLWQDMSWRNLSQKNLSFRGLLTFNICLRIQFQLHLPNVWCQAPDKSLKTSGWVGSSRFTDQFLGSSIPFPTCVDSNERCQHP